MRIDKIELCNFAALQGNQVLDFTGEPLRSAGVCALIDDRWLVLDAISMALYARPFGCVADEENALLSMVNSGEQTASCQVTFSLPDGTSYQVQWSANQRKTSDPVKRSLKKIYPKTENITLVEGTIESLTGFTYEQFRNTIVLPQQGVADFLQSKSSERCLLLESLTGSEVYSSISVEVNERALEAQTAFDNLVKRMEDIKTNCLSDEELNILNKNLNLCRDQFEEKRSEIELLKEQIGWYDRYEDLKRQLKECETEQQEMLRSYNSMHDQKLLLDRYDMIIPFQKLYFDIKQMEESILQFKEIIEEKQRVLHQKQQNQRVSFVAYTADDHALLEMKKQDERLQPKFSEGLVLQGEIAARKQVVEHLAEETEHLRNIVSQKEMELQGMMAEEKNLKAQIENTNARLQTISMHHYMFNNVEKVKVMLTNISNLDADTKSLNKSIENETLVSTQLKKQINDYQRESNKYLSEIEGIKEEIRSHMEYTRGFDLDELQRTQDAQTSTYSKIQGAISLWKRIDEEYNSLDSIQKLIREKEIVYNHLKEEVKILGQKLEQQEKTLDASRRSYMLSQSANIKELRRQLREGESCVVCGATHHPYHSETEVEMGRLLLDLEKEYALAQSEMEKTRPEYFQKCQEQTAMEGELRILKNDCEKIKQTLQEDKNAWKVFENLDNSFHDVSSSVNRPMRSILLHQKEEKTAIAQGKQKGISKSVFSHQGKINELNGRLQVVFAKLRESNQSLQNVQKDNKMAEAHIEDWQRQSDQAKQHLSTSLGAVGKYISIPLWHQKWNEDHNLLLQEIMSLSEQWNEYQKTLNDAKQRLGKLSEEILAAKQWLDDKNAQIYNLEQQKEQGSQFITRGSQRISQMFNGIMPEEALTMHREKMEDLTQKATSSKQQYDEYQSEVERIKIEIETIQHMQEEVTSQLHQCRSDLDVEIARHNNRISGSPVQYFELEKFFLDTRSWNELRTQIYQHYEALCRSKFLEESIDIQIAEWQNHPSRPSEAAGDNRQALDFRLSQAAKALQDISEQTRKYEVILHAHCTALDTLESLESERLRLEELAARWGKLNQAIGSSDGSKFREIAQKAIFSQIVSLANHYLTVLDSRYRLAVGSGFLKPQILDTFMLSQPIGLQTLLSSDRFLLTLSFSLALSAYHAGGTHQANLFVAEGFDGLDGKSLHLILKALEKLSRKEELKLCLVSHAPVVRNQVFPQICLQRVTVGRSLVSVS